MKLAKPWYASLLGFLLLGGLLPGCPSEQEPPTGDFQCGDTCVPSANEFPAALDGDALRVPAGLPALVISQLDVESNTVTLLNRGPQLFHAESLEIWSLHGYERFTGDIPAFDSVSIELPLEDDADFVLVAAERHPFQLLEYGAPFTEVPLREYLWAGEPIAAPASGQRLIPRHPVFMDLPRSADSYRAATPGEGREVLGRVADLEGNPIEAASVDVVCDASASWSSAGASVQTAADGSFSLSAGETSRMCWLRVRKEGYETNVRPYLASHGAADLGKVPLVRHETTPGTRTSPTRIDFAGGAWLEAAAEDLDALGALYFTRVPVAASRLSSLDPMQVGGAFIVHGSDPSQHVTFSRGDAHLNVPLSQHVSPLLGDAPAVILPVGESAASDTPVGTTSISGVVVLTADHAEVIVDRFSGVQTVFESGSWKVVKEELEGSSEPHGAGTCTCKGKNADGACAFSALTFSAKENATVSASEADESKFSSTLGFEDSGASGSVGGEMVSKFSRSLNLGAEAGTSFTCTADQPTPLLCHDAAANISLTIRNVRFTLQNWDYFRFGVVELVTDGEDVGYCGGFFHVVIACNPFTTVLVTPTPTFQWNDEATMVLSFPSGCGSTEYSYTPDYPGCGCQQDTTAPAGALTLTWRPIGVTDPPGLSCPGIGFMDVTRTLNVTPGGGVGATCTGQQGAMSSLCAEPLAAMTDATCQQKCMELPGNCTQGTLLTDPTPSATMACTPQGAGLALSCSATGRCRCDRDTDGDGIYDLSDPDDDNDSVPDTEDDFPTDPSESADTDGDGIGDNEDEDDDNDGIPDIEDAFPKDPNEFLDTDGDRVGDNADEDDDNDGIPDIEDAFPKDPNEFLDTDRDGVGDNADEDDDNDSIPDIEDAFPKDPNEFMDTDGDRVGDNADEDDDNDGVPDTDDAFPKDPTQS